MTTTAITPVSASIRETRRYKSDAETFRKLFNYALLVIGCLSAIIIAMAFGLVRSHNATSDMVSKINRLSADNLSLRNEVANLNQTIAEMDGSIQTLESVNSTNASTIKRLNSNISELKGVVDELDESNAALVKENEKLDKLVAKFETREELFDKYEYAIYNKQGNRTDLTYKQIKTGEQLMKDKGMDPDLLFGLIMTESACTEKAKNSASTARGYGQLLRGTAKSMYENVLGHGKGTYNHDMAFDGDTNILLTATYLGYLKNTCNYSLRSTIIGYRGLYDPAYFNTIDSYIKKSGNSLTQIAANW